MVSFEIKESELRSAIKKLDGLGKAINTRQRKAMLRKGALIIRDTARANVPISDRPTLLYNTKKLDGTLKAGKGDGTVKQEYDPGTLRDDINVLSFRRSPDLFVGAGQRGKITAYWAHWEEFGTKDRKGSAYMRRAVESSKGAAIDQVVRDAQKLFDRTIKKLATS